MKQLKHLLGQEWDISPAGGATGEAFIASKEDQKIFLKRNSSPFLAVLSAEGIVPKLLWTRRVENGDVITAQHWIPGRELSPFEMMDDRVAQMLQKIHQSDALLSMLTRLGKSPLKPETIFAQIKRECATELADMPIIAEGLLFLENHVLVIGCDNYVVCHRDMNHNNWIITEQDELLLIDWDGAVIADPAIDLGMLLYSYVPRAEWSHWLERYGIMLDAHLNIRMKWHTLSQALLSIQWYHEKGRLKERDQLLAKLARIIAS